MNLSRSDPLDNATNHDMSSQKKMADLVKKCKRIL